MQNERPYASVSVDLHIDAIALLREHYPSTTPEGRPDEWSARQLSFVLNALAGMQERGTWDKSHGEAVVICHG